MSAMSVYVLLLGFGTMELYWHCLLLCQLYGAIFPTTYATRYYNSGGSLQYYPCYPSYIGHYCIWFFSWCTIPIPVSVKPAPAMVGFLYLFTNSFVLFFIVFYEISIQSFKRLHWAVGKISIGWVNLGGYDWKLDSGGKIFTNFFTFFFIVF